jgi:hypothetical protein
MSAKRAVLVVVIALAVCSSCYSAKTLFSGDEKVPAYSVVLFDGKNLSEWVSSGSGKPAAWKVRDDYMEVSGGDIQTIREFGDFQLHVEFWLPNTGEAKGQARANSGVYLQNAYEVQVLDSYGLESNYGDCGAVYSIAAPAINACRPPEHWQSFDMIFRAARFDAQGKKTGNAVVTVLQNGVCIHNCLEIPHSTPGGIDAPKIGPIRLQDHGCPVRYRNIWVMSLEPMKQ